MKKTILLFSSLATLSFSSAYAQDNDPFAVTDPFGPDPYKGNKIKNKNVPTLNERKENLSHCIEVFSMPLMDAAEFQRSKPSDQQLYDQLVKDLANKKVKQEQFIILKGKSGERLTSESTIEHIYPVEYSPVKSQPDNQNLAAVYPTSFETRNVGITVRCVTHLSKDNKVADINLIIESLASADYFKYGKNETAQIFPKFENRLGQIAITTLIGSPTLLSTLNHPPFSVVDQNAGNKVYFVFLTMTMEQLK